MTKSCSIYFAAAVLCKKLVAVYIMIQRNHNELTKTEHQEVKKSKQVRERLATILVKTLGTLTQ